ncbi:MAG: tyrosine--tRNA ligase [Candidatus Aenigmarchaeota archaeon]|nr:tyrosine--tRNA ligase [Candidatus Aenigmarchaeota archaeon]
MDVEERLRLIKLPPTEEIVTEEELKELLETKKHPRAYDGFETSGLLHLGSGILRAIKLQDFLDAGCKFTLYIADWFAYLNNKLGGDLELIRKTGEYYIEGWKACGVNMEKVDVVWASDLAQSPEYWETFLKISKHVTLNRVKRTVTIMGRKETEIKQFAFLVYPIMQATDIFMLKADICQLGIDQRKVNMLAREIGPKIGFWKPVVVSHHLLMGLQGPTRMGGFEEDKKLDTQISSKMSKSKPMTAVFIHDTPDEIRVKIKRAYCLARDVKTNPILEIVKYIIFRKFKTFVVERAEKYGGTVEYVSYSEVEKDFAQGKLHPLDLKNAVAEYLIKIIDPVRRHFERNPKARKLYEIVKEAQITR